MKTFKATFIALVIAGLAGGVFYFTTSSANVDLGTGLTCHHSLGGCG